MSAGGRLFEGVQLFLYFAAKKLNEQLKMQLLLNLKEVKTLF